MKNRDHLNHISFLYKPKLEYIKSFIKNVQNINILEFGVMHGRSTKMFLELCKNLDGKLTSVDMNTIKIYMMMRIGNLFIPEMMIKSS